MNYFINVVITSIPFSPPDLLLNESCISISFHDVLVSIDKCDFHLLEFETETKSYNTLLTRPGQFLKNVLLIAHFS